MYVYISMVYIYIHVIYIYIYIHVMYIKCGFLARRVRYILFFRIALLVVFVVIRSVKYTYNRNILKLQSFTERAGIIAEPPGAANTLM